MFFITFRVITRVLYSLKVYYLEINKQNFFYNKLLINSVTEKETKERASSKNKYTSELKSL